MCCAAAVPPVSPGVIVNADQPADKRPRLQGAAFNGPPTRVLVLRNMVGPGEVDEDLEEEVRCCVHWGLGLSKSLEGSGF